MGRASIKFLLLFLLVPSVSYAQVKAHYLPEGTDIVVGGVEKRCFDLEEGKELYRIDGALYAANSKLFLLEQKLRITEDLSDLRDKKVDLSNVMAQAWEGEYKRLHAKWVEENRLLHECQEKVSVVEWTSIHWLVLGGEVVLLVLGTALLFSGT